MSGADEPIVVVYGVDNRFAVPLAASIASVVANLVADQRIDIYIIDGGLSRRNRSRIARSFERKSCRIIWLRPPAHEVSYLRVGGAVTVATYYRLLIPELLPASQRKAIYLDADVIVHADLSGLWNLSLGDQHLLAVQDQGIRLVSGPHGLPNYRELGIPTAAKHFNGGVLVLNLDKWRQDAITPTILAYLRNNHDHIRFYDQDGLNAVLWNSWGELDPRWNQMPQILQVKTAEEGPFDADTFRNVIAHPYITHYASDDKPWRFGCRHPATGRFFFYLDRTAYRGFRPSRWHTRANDTIDFFRKRLRKLAVLARLCWAGTQP